MVPGTSGSHLQSWLFRRQRSGGSQFEVNPGKWFLRPYLEKKNHNKGLVEWLKVSALSLNPSTKKKKKKEERKKKKWQQWERF
jgi:hypothetical protein